MSVCLTEEEHSTQRFLPRSQSVSSFKSLNSPVNSPVNSPKLLNSTKSLNSSQASPTLLISSKSIMARRPTVTVIHNNESVSLLVPQASLTYKDFDAWVRSRFLFNHDDQLIFYDSVDKSKEIIPVGLLETSEDQLEIIVDRIQKKKVEPSIVKAHPLVKFLVIYGPSLLLMLLTITFAEELYSTCIERASNPQDCRSSPYVFLTTVFQSLSAKPGWNKLVYEFYIGFLTWSTTYLFVRRLPNPENGDTTLAYEKFATDAVFGGFAAGVAAFMKQILR